MKSLNQIEVQTVKFAWIPKKLSDNSWIWLKNYKSIGYVVYPSISSSFYSFLSYENPYYVELEKLPLKK